MAITALTSTDSGADSLTTINGNFTDLDTTKADLASPSLTGNPTAPTQSASDNSTKIATTAYADNAASAATVPTVLTSVPRPLADASSTNITNNDFNSNTTQYLGMIYLPAKITVNNIYLPAVTATAAGTLDVVIYSEDGQTQLISETTPTISGAGTVTIPVSSVELEAGNYYIGINPNSTANIRLYCWVTSDLSPFNSISGEAMLTATTTITAGTPATSFTPSSLTYSTGNHIPLIRLAN